jgi:hypothetical protein
MLVLAAFGSGGERAVFTKLASSCTTLLQYREFQRNKKENS